MLMSPSPGRVPGPTFGHFGRSRKQGIIWVVRNFRSQNIVCYSPEIRRTRLAMLLSKSRCLSGKSLGRSHLKAATMTLRPL